MRYLQIQIKGYRALADVTLELHPLTVMIGPNGCGKTSLLDVFQLLKEATHGQLEEALTTRGGLATLLSQTPDSQMSLEIGVKVDIASPRSSEPMYYSFTLRPNGGGYAITSERLKWDLDPSSSEPYLDIERKDKPLRHLSLLSDPIIPRNAPRNVDPATVAIRENQYLADCLAKTLYLSSLDIDSRAPIRLPQTLIPVTYPGQNGELLYAALYNIRESRVSRSSYERIEDTLRLAFPDFDRLELPVVGGGQITLRWYSRYQKGTAHFYPNQLSEGTLRFLWLITTLLSPEPPPLILIDEPEISLHPELLKILAALLQDASARTQILVATHSSDLIRWLQPDEVVVIDKVDGKAAFTWASDPSLNLGEWLKEYTLRDLWLMGNLDGRP
ncbi:MAG TPA: AAA family ATPase [Anaerolineae bacterium]